MAVLDDLLAAVETISVAFWAGAAAGYAFLAAPTVAHEANDLDLQARITGTVLGRVVDVANVCEAAAIACALVRVGRRMSARTIWRERWRASGRSLHCAPFARRSCPR